MITITILGSGKVAHHLILNMLECNNLHIKQIYARNTESLVNIAPKNTLVNDIKLLESSDVFIIAVSDHAIEEIAKQIKIPNQLVIHTSGTMPLSILPQERKGVLYMLQSFSKEKELDFSSIPFCIEANIHDDFLFLEQLALNFSERVYKISSDQRRVIHLAAVFVNNFANHMFTLGEDICRQHQIPFEILKPLILETAQKVMFLSPKEAQTGPASRADQNTINKHLEMISDNNLKEIYQIITNSIQKNNVKAF